MNLGNMEPPRRNKNNKGNKMKKLFGFLKIKKRKMAQRGVGTSNDDTRTITSEEGNLSNLTLFTEGLDTIGSKPQFVMDLSDLMNISKQDESACLEQKQTGVIDDIKDENIMKTQYKASIFQNPPLIINPDEILQEMYFSNTPEYKLQHLKNIHPSTREKSSESV